MPDSLAMSIHNITTIVQIKWEEKPSGYAENPDKRIFL
jgi:hypothetical protein